MKNKILAFLLAFGLVLTLSGCGNQVDPALVEEQFSAEFVSLNKEEDTAEFRITGYPDEKEFQQIEKVVLDSMNNQDLDKNVEFDVSVFSNRDTGEAPMFGMVKYKDSKIIENNLKEPTEDQYLNAK